MVGASESSPHCHREVNIPPCWAEAADAIACATSQPSVVFICGPKNSGKSTFSRFLLNTLLRRYKRIGYLDTDVGQAEFSPPGCLSLHMVDEIIPDLTKSHIRTPERCFFFGDISSKRDPEAYLNCTFNLYNYFLKEHYVCSEPESLARSTSPLIINTPGWVKGTGYDILVEMLRYMSPTLVVQIRISIESKNLPTGLFWVNNEETRPIDMINISSAHQDSLNRSLLIQKDARGMRDQRLIEYFKQCFPNDMNITTNKELAYALASLPPYVVPLSKIKVTHLHCQVPRSEIWHSLNATIVGLAVNSDESVRSSIHLCVGLGIVRGVDVKKGMLYIITPVPYCSLQNVDILLQGLVEIPTSILQLYCPALKNGIIPLSSTDAVHPPVFDLKDLSILQV